MEMLICFHIENNTKKIQIRTAKLTIGNPPLASSSTYSFMSRVLSFKMLI